MRGLCDEEFRRRLCIGTEEGVVVLAMAEWTADGDDGIMEK